MMLTDDACYQALVTHDSRFDGRFFVGVTSTGIYCRTVCPARTPRRENCTFFPYAAAAEKAGYRPCLRCRPELAPGKARVDARSRLAAAALGKIEDGFLAEHCLEELAARLGVTGRHLRRVVEQETGVSPVEWAQTQRLLLAKRLLTDTDLPVTEVALASGFSSLSRFNTLFRERYRLNPTQLRRTRSRNRGTDTLSTELPYRPPLDWQGLLRFLAAHALPGVEAVLRERYLRTVRLGKYTGWLAVSRIPERHTLKVELSASLAPAFLAVLSRVKRLFDIESDPTQWGAALPVAAAQVPGLRVPGAFDGFSVAVFYLLGPGGSEGAETAEALETIERAGRWVRACGEPVTTPFPELTHLPPLPEQIASVEQAPAVKALAHAVSSGALVLEPGAAVEATRRWLETIPEITRSQIEWILLRTLCWPDAFPGGQETAETRTHPWRAYQALSLWHLRQTESKGACL